MSESWLPQVYASPTAWNERIISLLSSVAFRRYHRHAFVDATSQRLPFSLEVQNPSLKTNSSAGSPLSSSPPILLIVLSLQENDELHHANSILDYFAGNAEQSSAFLLFHQSTSRNGDDRKLANIVHLIANSPKAIPIFLVLIGTDISTAIWKQIDDLKSSCFRQNSGLQGVVSIHVEESLLLGPQRQSPSECLFSQSNAIPYLKVHIGPTTLSDYALCLRNPNLILMTVPELFPSASLWLARVLFKFMFAVLQLNVRNDSIKEHGSRTRARL
ncbi:hypothetical protein ACA910_016908 [Epithemia clementina (nom. ined.)]